jgi:hypothetical protein
VVGGQLDDFHANPHYNKDAVSASAPYA